MTQLETPDLPYSDKRTIPRATYRLQFTKVFGFKAAAAIAPYLANLGVSHVYASPFLKARPGSTHGYDIVSHTELNPELGSEDDFRAMVAAFKAHGLGQILDFVPNHMGVGGADNPWWLDVLEWGPHSEFAGWFDIDWRSDHQYLRDKLLVPFLGDHYGRALEAGDLLLRFDQNEGSFAVWAYGTHKLPICPRHYGNVLGNDHPELERLGDMFANLGERHAQAMNRATILKAELAGLHLHDSTVREAIDRVVARFKGTSGDLETWSRLQALIERQFWRPAYFRAAAADINYRRFFNVNDLAGIRMEIPELFDHAHNFIMTLLADGAIDGIRLDHIDGLLDPKSYCHRLRSHAPRSFYLLVEKILAPHERLRESWNVDGTTGYEFANLLTGLLIDASGEDAMTALYSSFTGCNEAFEDIVRYCKLQIMDNELASELNVLARAAGRIARSNPHTADFTDNILQRGLREVVACFPVYRTYVDRDGADQDDRRDIDWAFARARRNEPNIDIGTFDFLQQLMSGELVQSPRSGFSRTAVFDVIMRTQQYSGPVMAKGLEDTAFYRYNRLLALNEVGGQPQRFGVSIAAFHQANGERARRMPFAMLASSTHDTKRGEDARARLAVLPEIAEEWTRHVELWHRILRTGYVEQNEATLSPDKNDEYAFYQMLLGSWPAELSVAAVPDAAALESFRTRLEGAMIKALREARLHTTWGAPDTEYEEATLAFIRRALDVSRKNLFLESFVAFAERISLFGWHNSIVQLVAKLTAPGVPDIYHGADQWELSMVDPDNRRAVDFAARTRELRADAPLSDLSARWRDGGLKLWLTRTLLDLRKTFPDVFLNGTYQPLATSGKDAARVCTYMRTADETTVVVAVCLFPGQGPAVECDAEIHGLPDDRVWRNVFNGGVFHRSSISARDLFIDLPVAVLASEGI
jgi:(1->4)-alpha-D-glucan 1-alpha-D-glucosylmutase